MSEHEENLSELKDGEHHPAAEDAFYYVNDKIHDFILVEAIASAALSGDRVSAICSGTISRLINKEPVSDRYLLGLAWFLKGFEESFND